MSIWLDNDGYIRIDVANADISDDVLGEFCNVCHECGCEVNIDEIGIDLIAGTLWFYYYCYYCDNDFCKRFDLQEREEKH